MIVEIILAVIVAAVIGLVLAGLLGPVLKSVDIPIVAVLGDFFVRYGWALGILAGLWFFFAGGSFFGLDFD
jgi:hypothetical protein